MSEVLSSGGFMTDKNGYGVSKKSPVSVKFAAELSHNLSYGGYSETPAYMNCYDDWMSRHNLSAFVLENFVKAVGSGDRDIVQMLFDKMSPLNDSQKRALLTITYNYSHFIGKPDIRMGTAIKQASGLDKKDIVAYLTEQKAKLCPSVVGVSIFQKHSEKPSVDEDKKQSVKKMK